MSLALLPLVLPAAHAYVYIGNPPLTLQVVRDAGDLTGGAVWLRGIRVHRCGGGYDDYLVDASIDPTEPFTIGIEGGDLCGVTARWDSDLSITGSTFTARYEYPTTSVALTGAASDATTLSPLVVTSGTLSGSAPELRVTIED